MRRVSVSIAAVLLVGSAEGVAARSDEPAPVAFVTWLAMGDGKRAAKASQGTSTR